MKPYFTNALDKVLLDGPSGVNKLTSGMAFRNETVNVQIVLPPLTQYSPGDVALRYALRTNLDEGVQLYKVDHVPVGNVSAGKIDEDILSNADSLYPDVLKAVEYTGEFTLNPEQWNSLWLEVDISQTDTDTVEFEFEYSTENVEETVHYELEVIDKALPKQTTIHTEWFHTDSLCHYYEAEPFSEDYWTVVENYLRMAYEHSQNTVLTPLFTPPLDTAEGEERLTVQLVGIEKKGHIYSFDFTKLNRWSEMLKEIGFEYIEFPPFFTQWGAKFTPKIVVHEEGVDKKRFGWHVPYDSPDYKAFLEAFLPEMDQWVLDNGWDEKAFFHVSDEPNEESLENYKYGKELLRKHIKNGFFVDALSEYTFYKNNLVDIPVAGTPSIDGFLGKDVESLWSYYCGIHNDKVSNRYIAQHPRRTRIIGYQIYKENVQGFLHWGYNFWFTQLSKEFINPYEVTDAGGGFPSGDAFVVYPGEDLKPIPSLRLKIMKEAFQDIRACQLLESLTDRETVLNIIDKHIPNLDFYSYGESIQNIDALRDDIIQTIKEI